MAMIYYCLLVKREIGNSVNIGIITWFTGPNYGTNLQAIALQYFLRKKGHEVSIINYEVDSPIEKTTVLQKLKNQPRKFVTKYALKKYSSQIMSRNEKMANEIKRNCQLTERIQNTEELINVCNNFDVLICGSDQIWNPNWYHPFYYADYSEILTRRISYAPSLGVNEISDEVLPNIINSLGKFDCVSVREEKGAELIAPYIRQKPQVVLDPTLLLSATEWNNIFPEVTEMVDSEKDKYVLAFFLGEEPKHFQATRNFANRHNLKCILVPYKGISYLQNMDIRADVSTADLMHLIRNAKYIITDSFHMTIFSIIHKKQFYTFKRFKEDFLQSQNVRVTNLLELFQLRNRMVENCSAFIGDFEDINYKEVLQILDFEKEKSEKFLLNSLE